jgi:ferrochelatase
VTEAVLWLSFGSPENPDDIWPFLKQVTAGRNVPDERLAIVRDQYLATGGSSPLNRQNRDIIARIVKRLEARGRECPIYFGNRNWHPLVSDTARTMAAHGVTSALVIATSAFGSYSGCRQYQEDLERASIRFEYLKLKPFALHPKFLAAQAEVAIETFSQCDPSRTSFIFTAHSIPSSMAAVSPYERQLAAVSSHLGQALTEHFGQPVEPALCYQSRSGNPSTPWLEPDVGDFIESDIARRPGIETVALMPIGFISDHQEVLYDLDILARNRAEKCGLSYLRAPAVSSSDIFIDLMADFVEAWLDGNDPSSEIPDCQAICDETCCRE